VPLEAGAGGTPGVLMEGRAGGELDVVWFWFKP
jgi:hypothetical protein